jgi:hypothetical protein
VWPHDGRQTQLLEDEFLRQLAGGSLAYTEAAPVTRPRPRRPETPRNATDPHAPHPIGGAARKLLSFSYLAYGDDTAPAPIARARLDVTAPIRMVARESLAHRGESAELAGRSAPAASLTLQADPPEGRGWRTLARVRAGRDGRWRARVRVPRTAIGGRYRFRARAAPSPRQGYAAAASRPAAIGVR